MLPAGYDISTDQARLDLDTIYEFLSLYEQFGFEPLLHPERFLAIYRPGRP